MSGEVVASTAKRRKLREWRLVLNALGIPHFVEAGEGGMRLIVVKEEALAQRAREEIALFEEENRDWPSRPQAVPEQEPHPPTWIILAFFALFYLQTGGWDGQSFWFDAGAADARRFLHDHQWWRAVTALTLHADVVHLAGNLLIGGTIIHFIAAILGTGLAWTAVIFCGAMANGVNMFFHGSGHVSVGFSTAVFAAVGILAAMNCWRHGQWKGVLLSFGAGMSLLAILGTSGERVDLGAHLWGFVVGFLAGNGLGAWIRARRPLPGYMTQAGLLAGCLGLVYLCWQRALW